MVTAPEVASQASTLSPQPTVRQMKDAAQDKIKVAAEVQTGVAGEGLASNGAVSNGLANGFRSEGGGESAKSAEAQPAEVNGRDETSNDLPASLPPPPPTGRKAIPCKFHHEKRCQYGESGENCPFSHTIPWQPEADPSYRGHGRGPSMAGYAFTSTGPMSNAYPPTTGVNGLPNHPSAYYSGPPQPQGPHEWGVPAYGHPQSFAPPPPVPHDANSPSPPGSVNGGPQQQQQPPHPNGTYNYYPYGAPGYGYAPPVQGYPYYAPPPPMYGGLPPPPQGPMGYSYPPPPQGEIPPASAAAPGYGGPEYNGVPTSPTHANGSEPGQGAVTGAVGPAEMSDPSIVASSAPGSSYSTGIPQEPGVAVASGPEVGAGYPTEVATPINPASDQAATAPQPYVYSPNPPLVGQLPSGHPYPPNHEVANRSRAASGAPFGGRGRGGFPGRGRGGGGRARFSTHEGTPMRGPPMSTPDGSDDRGPRGPCSFFAAGVCMYADRCMYAHVMPNGDDAKDYGQSYRGPEGPDSAYGQPAKKLPKTENFVPHAVPGFAQWKERVKQKERQREREREAALATAGASPGAPRSYPGMPHMGINHSSDSRARSESEGGPYAAGFRNRGDDGVGSRPPAHLPNRPRVGPLAGRLAPGAQGNRQAPPAHIPRQKIPSGDDFPALSAGPTSANPPKYEGHTTAVAVISTPPPPVDTSLTPEPSVGEKTSVYGEASDTAPTTVASDNASASSLSGSMNMQQPRMGASFASAAARALATPAATVAPRPPAAAPVTASA